MPTREEVKNFLAGKDKSGRQIRPPVIPEIAKAYQNDPRTQMAVNSLAGGASTAPVAGGKYAYADGIARVLQGVAGGYMDRKQQERYRTDEDALLKLRAARGQEGITGMAPPPAAVPPQAAMPPQPAPGAPPAQVAPAAMPPGAPPAASQIAMALQGQPTPQAAPAPVPGPPSPMPGSPVPQTGGQPGGRSPFPVSSGGSIDLSHGANLLKASGARITSGYRTPAHNAEVGGVANSYHTRGTPDHPQAYDFAPKQGETMAQLEVRARAAFPGFDVINEGDHIHVEPSRQMTRGGTATRDTHGNSVPPPPAGPINAFAPPVDQPVPELPPAMARPTAPESVAATKSPLLRAAYQLMIDANPYESATGQDMYAKGLTEQGGFDEAAAERQQGVRNMGYSNDLGMYAQDTTQRRGAQIAERQRAIDVNESREDAYVAWKRDASEKEKDRRVRVEEAQIQAAAKGGGGVKALPPGAVDKLVTAGSMLDAADMLKNTFDKRFVGRTVTGGVGIAVNKVVGGDKELNDWWQAYQSWTAEVRHPLYGASLTKNEKAAFDKVIVTPRMDADLAASRLAQQQQIIETALGRRARAYATQYNPEAISEAIGRDPATMGAAGTTSATTGGWGGMTVRQ